MASTPVLHLRVRNELAAVEAARQSLTDFMAPFDAPPRVMYRLELVVEEALMNRLWHAWPEGGEHHTTLDVEVLPDTLRLRFEDDGMPFDPTEAAAPQRPASLSDAVPGGLGLLLTRRAVRDVRYERVDGLNRLVLEIERTGAPVDKP